LRQAALPETGQPPDALLRRRLPTISLPCEKMGNRINSLQRSIRRSNLAHFRSGKGHIVRELFDGLVWNPVTSVDGVFVLVAGVGGVS